MLVSSIFILIVVPSFNKRLSSSIPPGKVEPASTDTDTRSGNTNTHGGGTANVTGDKKGGGDKRNGTLEEETSGRNDDRHDDKMMQVRGESLSCDLTLS